MDQGVNIVDRQRRSDEVFFFLEDRPSLNVLYLGRAAAFDTPFDRPAWQIKRISRSTSEGGIQRIMWANDGKYNLKWSDRTTYFTSAGAGPPLFGQFGSSTPTGLTVAGLTTVVELTDGAWRPIPPTPMPNRNAMSIYNESGFEMRMRYTDTAAYNGPLPGDRGTKIIDGGEAHRDVTDQIVIYGRLEFGAGTQLIVVEEIS